MFLFKSYNTSCWCCYGYFIIIAIIITIRKAGSTFLFHLFRELLTDTNSYTSGNFFLWRQGEVSAKHWSRKISLCWGSQQQTSSAPSLLRMKQHNHHHHNTTLSQMLIHVLAIGDMDGDSLNGVTKKRSVTQLFLSLCLPLDTIKLVSPTYISIYKCIVLFLSVLTLKAVPMPSFFLIF